jgi:hypothetical protein
MYYVTHKWVSEIMSAVSQILFYSLKPLYIYLKSQIIVAAAVQKFYTNFTHKK